MRTGSITAPFKILTGVDPRPSRPTIRGMALFGRPTAEDNERAAAWGEWIRDRNPLAISSLVLGIFSLIEFGALLIFGIAGIVLGVMALKQLRNRGAEDVSPAFGHRLAITGIVLSAVSLVIATVLFSRRHPF